MSASKSRTALVVGGVLVLGVALAGVLRWTQTTPRCDPDPLEELGRALVTMDPGARLGQRDTAIEAVEQACPVVPHELGLATSHRNEGPEDDARFDVGAALELPCAPQDPASAGPEDWRACAELAGHPATLMPDRALIGAQLFFEDQGVSREAALALAWTLRSDPRAPAVPEVSTWSTATLEHEAPLIIDAAGERGPTHEPRAFAIAPDLASEVFTSQDSLRGEFGRPVLLRALSTAHGEAFPAPVWLPIFVGGYEGTRAPCLTHAGIADCGDGRLAAEIGLGRLWIADAEQQVELPWGEHEELVALLANEPALAWARGRPAWIAITDPAAVQWRSFVALVDLFAPDCDPNWTSPEQPRCAEPFVAVYLGDRVANPSQRPLGRGRSD